MTRQHAPLSRRSFNEDGRVQDAIVFFKQLLRFIQYIFKILQLRALQVPVGVSHGLYRDHPLPYPHLPTCVHLRYATP